MELAEEIAHLTVADIAAMPRDAFVWLATERVIVPRVEELEARADAVWNATRKLTGGPA